MLNPFHILKFGVTANEAPLRAEQASLPVDPPSYDSHRLECAALYASAGFFHMTCSADGFFFAQEIPLLE